MSKTVGDGDGGGGFFTSLTRKVRRIECCVVSRKGDKAGSRRLAVPAKGAYCSSVSSLESSSATPSPTLSSSWSFPSPDDRERSNSAGCGHSCIGLSLPATYPPQIAIKYARERTPYPASIVASVFDYHAGRPSPTPDTSDKSVNAVQQYRSLLPPSTLVSLAYTQFSGGPSFFAIDILPRTSSIPSSTHSATDTRSPMSRSQSSSSQQPSWESALDLACGHGTLAFHLKTRFVHVFGRDPNAEAIIMARSLQKLEPGELDSDRLPPQSGSTIDFGIGSVLDPNLPTASVDLITIGSAAHKFDWSTQESRKAIWNSIARILRPGGTLAVLGLRVVIAEILAEGPERQESNDELERRERCAEALQSLLDSVWDHPSLPIVRAPTKVGSAPNRVGSKAAIDTSDIELLTPVGNLFR
ncbi:hypothetical protein A4X13_0g323 [Tilletia indica]|uniref:Methyltransferase type 11 domain-containing protein n=1 Tax=Tilletia indica TaxID=43049 RepID=A0A177TRM7_9BASI|nr:hypothetical protein A4X13_0g323 [Tilletia indica]